MRIAFIATLLLATTCVADARLPKRDVAADNAAKLAKALDGLTPGDPQTCIGQSLGRFQTETIGKTILYKVSRKLIYANETSGGCENAQFGDALVSSNFGAQVCNGQIIRTVDFARNFQTGGCSLGRFTPYRAK